MKKFLLVFSPFVVIGIIWFIFASPYFLKNKVPYPSEYQVSFFGPWREYDQYALPVKNNALSDVVNEILPWKHFTIEELQKGNLPVWNPYSFSGTPHLANYQSAVFSPLNVLFFVLPFIDAWSFLVLLQPLFAGIFMYLFAKQLRLSSTASLIASTAYMFCGFITVWMAYGSLALAASFLPLILFAIEKIFTKYSFWFALIALLGLAFSFFSGHFQTSLYVFCFVVAYVLFKLFATKNMAAFFWSIAAVTGGIFVALLQILPSLELYALSVRSTLFSNSDGIPWYYLITVFAPDFFGNPVTRNDWIGHYAEWASFIGIVPILFAGASLFIKDKRKTIFFFLVAGLIALLLSLDTPLQQLLAQLKVPVFSTSIPSRIIFLFSFSFAVLAGFGFDEIINRLKQKSLLSLVFPLLPAVLLVGIAWVSAVLLPVDKAALAKRNLLLPTALFGGALIVMLYGFFIKKNRLFLLVPCLVFIFVAFDSLRFAGKWMPFDEKKYVFPNLPVISAMQKHIGQGRFYGNSGAQFDTYYHFPSIQGYDPLYSARYGEFIQSASTGEYTSAVRSVVSLKPRGEYTQRVLDLLGVTVIYQPISHTNQSFAFPVWEHPENFPTVYRDERITLFKNESAMPRAQVFFDYEVITDKKQLLKRFYTDNFDFRNVLLLEEDPKIAETDQATEKGAAKIISYSPEKITIDVISTKPALLFLSDSYYPHWHVFVNRKEEKLFIANYTLRAVKIPEGHSTVEFRYQ